MRDLHTSNSGILRLMFLLGLGLGGWLGGTGPEGAVAAPPGFVLRDSGQRLGSPGSQAEGVALGDVDGDGDVDAVVAESMGPTRCWLNDGAGRFTAGPQALGSNALAVVLVDLGVTMHPEVVTLHDEDGGTVRVWQNLGFGNFSRRPERAVGGDLPSALAAGPLGGDLRPDFLVVRGLGRPQEIWLTVGAGDFAETAQTLEAPSGIDAALGDLDGDGDWDVFLAGGEDEAVWLNQGGAQGGVHGAFASAGPAFGGGLTLGVALADLDGDGDLDAFAAESEPMSDRVWINQGGAQGGVPARFADSGQRLGPGTGQSRAVALGDLDRDGDVDAVVARSGGGRVYWNRGAGTFAAAGDGFGSGPAEALALADLDGDGDLDVFLAKFGAPAEVWLSDVPQPTPVLPEYRIEAWAGTGTPGSGGDGGPALAASLEGPTDLAADASGVVYVVDGHRTRLRRVGTDGIISTLIRGESQGFGGDGGPVSQALFHGIRSVAVDGGGNVFVADVRNDRIRRIDAQGTVSTVAGNGMTGFAGDGGPAVAAALHTPAVVRTDAVGNLFLVDYGNARIRRVDTNGLITTVAGNGGTGFSGDGGPAVAAEIGSPRSLLVGPDGSLYLSTEPRQRIRRVSPEGIITTIAGTGVPGLRGGGGPALAARFDWTMCLEWDGFPNFLVGDWKRIRRIDGQGMIVTVAGGRNGDGGDGGPALAAGIGSGVDGLARLPGGDLLFAAGHRIRRLTATGAFLPVVPNVQPTPASGTELNLGEAARGVPHAWPELTVTVRNSGTADLTVRSVDLSGDTGAFRVYVSDRLLVPVPVPHPIPDGESEEALQIGITSVLETSSTATNRAVLRVTTDDPETPVQEYPLRLSVVPSADDTPEFQETAEESLLFLWVFLLNGSPALASAPSPSAPGRPVFLAAQATGPQEAVLRVDADQSHTVTSEIPAYLGGGSVTISNFQGQVRVEARPDPQDAESLLLTVLGGEFTAPSFRLPNGLPTGPTTLTFGDRSQSTGRLHRVTGRYTATASATIVNALFPNGLPVRGSYAGTFDAATGRAHVRSSSVDRILVTDRLQVVREGEGAVVAWNTASQLEMATQLAGPWQIVPQAVSPHPLDLRADGPRFYRLRRATGR